jgi:hypothetical protein
MGTLNNQVLGDLTGKLGGVIGRRRKGKFFIYAAPEEVKISHTPKAIKSRNIMIPLARFASKVNSVPELKYFWANSKTIAFDAFHKIEKINYHLFTNERPTLGNTIVPEAYFENKINGASISHKGIRLKIFIDKIDEIQLEGAREITGIGVISYFNPNGRGLDNFHLSKIRTSPVELKIEEQFEVNIPFNEEERSNYNSYLNSILYFTFVSKDSNGTPLRYFYNYRGEFIHEYGGEKERFRVCDSRA